MADRDGLVTPDKGKPGQVTSTDGFNAQFDAEVDRLVKMVEHIDSADKRLKDIKGQRDHYQKIYDQRAKQYTDTLAKLLNARKNTEKEVLKLRELQDQLHTALLELSDAGERNQKLYEDIRDEEMKYMKKGPKGGKK